MVLSVHLGCCPKFEKPENLFDSAVESKYCTSSRISVKLLRESREMDKMSILFPADSVAQLLEQRSGNPKMRVRISHKSTFLVDFSSVDQFMEILLWGWFRNTFFPKERPILSVPTNHVILSVETGFLALWAIHTIKFKSWNLFIDFSSWYYKRKLNPRWTSSLYRQMLLMYRRTWSGWKLGAATAPCPSPDYTTVCT